MTLCMQGLIALIYLLLLAPSISWSKGGISGGGGGNVITCPGPGGSEDVFLADVFGDLQSFDPQQRLVQRRQLPRLTSQGYLESLWRGWRQANPDMPIHKLYGKELELNWVPVRSLPLLGDDYIPAQSIPPGCQKRQLAIQRLADKTVFFDIFLYLKLSPLERFLFRMHEALIATRNRAGRDTTPIRKRIQRALQFAKLDTQSIPALVSKEKWSQLSLYDQKRTLVENIYFAYVHAAAQSPLKIDLAKLSKGGVWAFELDNWRVNNINRMAKDPQFRKRFERSFAHLCQQEGIRLPVSVAWRWLESQARDGGIGLEISERVLKPYR